MHLYIHSKLNMGILLHLITCFACIQVILSYPLRDDGSPLYDDYRVQLAKRDAFYPFKESLLSTLGFLENSREGMQNQRKKAVDSTFIRFGRSSSSESKFQPTSNTPKSPQEDSSDISKVPQQRFILSHNGCQFSNSQELLRALMNDHNCIRRFPKVKRENVNDTFIRFGKRSIPSEEQQNNSEEA